MSKLLKGLLVGGLLATVCIVPAVVKGQKGVTPVVINGVVQLDINKARAVYFKSQVNETSINVAVAEIERLSLKSPKEPIWLLIDSPGGSVFAGMRLANVIKNSKTPINTVCVDMCASMGFIIHQHGRSRYVFEYSTLMSHPVSLGLEGDINFVTSRLNYITEYAARIYNYIAPRTKMSYDELVGRSKHEYYIESQEAATKGFADAIVYFEISDVNPLQSGMGEDGYEQRKDRRNPERMRVTW